MNRLFSGTLTLSLTGAIRSLFIAIFLILFAVVSVMIWLDRSNILNSMSHNLVASRSDALKKSVQTYLNIPRQANATLASALQQYDTENVPLKDVNAILMNVMNSVYQGDTDLNLIQYGSKKGDYIGISHLYQHPAEEYLTLKDNTTNNVLTSYSGLTNQSGVSMRNEHYVMTDRPWFRTVNERQISVWTPLYRDQNAGKELGIAYSTPAYNKKGDFIGVIASELHLGDLSNKLHNLRTYSNSILLLVDEQHHIIASSLNANSVQSEMDDLPSLERESSPVLKAIVPFLSATQSSEVTKLKVGKDDYYATHFPISATSQGLSWQAVVIIPAAEVMGSVTLHGNYIIIALLIVFLLSSFLMHCLLARITSPLLNIARKTHEFDNGHWEPDNSKYKFREIVELESGFSNLSAKLRDSFEQLRIKIETDPVTGLHTRHGLLKDERIYNKRNLVALVHVTNAKSIMNTLGNKMADDLVKAFVAQLQDVLPTDIIISRDNIDKFVVVFPGINHEKDVQKYQQLINLQFSSVKPDKAAKGTHFLFSGNAGMVMQEITPDSIIDILMHAWLALHTAEKQGNAVSCLYSEEMLENELSNIRLHESLSDAIADNELFLVLQPIVRKDDVHSCSAGECLIRWHSKQLGEIPPDDFLPIAEESGLIIPLSRWVVEEACRELAALIQRGAPRDFRLHINVSPVQLLHRGFAWHLMDTIQLNGLSNENICIEITESVLQRDTQQAYQVLNYLRRHGIMISLDDFGAGFSSLSYLHTLPFDSIKIDRHFVAEQLKDDKSESVIRSILVLAKGFNVPLIAEGVEKADMNERLIAMGCDQVQGYHFARPARFTSWRCENNHFYYNQEGGAVAPHDSSVSGEV
ncbi:EAL domain-containing protein [Enterobacteriaceae bacterium RIT691]|nr:EAL domain-containing protein [Enterobacteriaceae bacterium RIT691]